jgi:branched-chain amino acid aminotransferase
MWDSSAARSANSGEGSGSYMGIVSTGNIDGRITPLKDARIPVTDRGFLYGDSVYEVFRTYEGIGFLYEAHWERLQNSARLIHMDIPYGKEEFFDEIRSTVIASGAPDAGEDVYVRYIVTRGDGPVDLFPQPDLRCRFVIMVKEVPTWEASFYSEGLTLAIPRVRRNPSSALNPNIKGGNYLNNVLGIIEARRRDADDCLLLNEEGLATESSTSNVFFVIGGRVVTPYQNAGNLIGLTKSTLLAICRKEGIETAETAISVGDMREAEECFLTSSTREVMPVRTLKFESGEVVSFPVGGGPLTRRLVELYKTFVSDYVREHGTDRLF